MSTILTALGSLALLLVSFALFAYSFGTGEPNAFVFFAGIVLMTGSASRTGAPTRRGHLTTTAC